MVERTISQDPIPEKNVLQIQEEFDEEWNKMIVEQRRIANTPIDEDELAEYHRAISSLSPEDLLRPFDI